MTVGAVVVGGIETPMIGRGSAFGVVGEDVTSGVVTTGVGEVGAGASGSGTVNAPLSND
jgi:hypothetical protein